MWKSKYQELKKYAEGQGLKILIKPYSKLLDYAAMNPMASKDMHWNCPQGEVWIEKGATWKKMFFDLRHELDEMARMERNGMEYGPAHKRALADEYKKEVPLYSR